MLKATDSLITGKKVRAISSDTINIDSGSVVVDNKWITYSTINYNIGKYIASAVGSPRTRFFINRHYSVMLVVGLNNLGFVTTVEGTQVKYTSNDGVPLPETIGIIPLIGIIVIQDGTNDLNSFKSISDLNLVMFSGSGNIKEKNIPGIQGMTGVKMGDTGLQGFTGYGGPPGLLGSTGPVGSTGIEGIGEKGDTGLQGITGINWVIHFPFQEVY